MTFISKELEHPANNITFKLQFHPRLIYHCGTELNNCKYDRGGRKGCLVQNIRGRFVILKAINTEYKSEISIWMS